MGVIPGIGLFNPAGAVIADSRYYGKGTPNTNDGVDGDSYVAIEKKAPPKPSVKFTPRDTNNQLGTFKFQLAVSGDAKSLFANKFGQSKTKSQYGPFFPDGDKDYQYKSKIHHVDTVTLPNGNTGHLYTFRGDVLIDDKDKISVGCTFMVSQEGNKIRLQTIYPQGEVKAPSAQFGVPYLDITFTVRGGYIDVSARADITEKFLDKFFQIAGFAGNLIPKGTAANAITESITHIVNRELLGTAKER